MKNKGFTLIEMLVVIALVAVISVTIGVNMSGLLSNEEDSKYKDYKSTLENAACLYAEENNITGNISVKTLYNNGYVKKSLTNSKTNKSVTEDENSVDVSINTEGEMTCTYKEN